MATSSDKGTVHLFSLRVRVVGEDPYANSSAASLAHQNSSTSLDALISRNTGANPGSSLSFMRGKIDVATCSFKYSTKLLICMVVRIMLFFFGGFIVVFGSNGFFIWLFFICIFCFPKLFQGYYQNISALNGRLLSSTCQKTLNSLQHLDLRTLSSLSAWMEGVELFFSNFSLLLLQLSRDLTYQLQNFSLRKFFSHSLPPFFFGLA